MVCSTGMLFAYSQNLLPEICRIFGVIHFRSCMVRLRVCLHACALAVNQCGDRTLYNSPMAMMDWLETRGLWPAWMDVHQSSGVSPVNSLFPEFAKAMGLPPATIPTTRQTSSLLTLEIASLWNRSSDCLMVRLAVGTTGGQQRLRHSAI